MYTAIHARYPWVFGWHFKACALHTQKRQSDENDFAEEEHLPVRLVWIRLVWRSKGKDRQSVTQR